MRKTSTHNFQQFCSMLCRCSLTRQIIVLIFISVFSSCAVTGYYSTEKKFSPQELKEDVKALEQTLKRNHPSLYWYSSPQQIEASFERAFHLAGDSLNENAFKNLIAETIFPIRCGHTSVRLSENYARSVRGRAPQGFPLNLKIADDSTLIITNNFNRRDSLLKPGLKILSINGLSASRVIDTLFPLVAIDGYAKNFSYQNISNSFSSYYNSRFPGLKNYTVTYTNDRNEVHSILIPSLGSSRDTTRRQVISTPPATTTERRRKINAVRSFTIDSSKTYALLRINSFTRYLKKSYLKKTFRKLERQQVTNLIIDVRNNGGGLIKSSLLLTRFIKQQPFYFTDSIFSKTRVIRSSVKVKKKFFHNIGMILLNRKQNDSLFRFSFFQKQYEPKTNAYKGNVIVLTGGYSFSATTMFLSNVKGQNNVTLLGEETGGGYYGNNGVFIPEIVLPNSKLRVRLPLYRIVNNRNFAKGNGVLPDIEVKATAESIKLNKDPKLEKAIELIKQRRK